QCEIVELGGAAGIAPDCRCLARWAGRYRALYGDAEGKLVDQISKWARRLRYRRLVQIGRHSEIALGVRLGHARRQDHPEMRLARADFFAGREAGLVEAEPDRRAALRRGR